MIDIYFILLPEKVVPFLATLAWSHDEATLMPLFTLARLSVSQSVYDNLLFSGDVGGVLGDDVIIIGERGEFKRAFDNDKDCK